MLSLPLSLLSLSLLASAVPVDVQKLFGRANSTRPQVGSDEWRAQYPPSGKTPSSVPSAWTDALQSAISRGLIPSPDVVPVATVTNDWPTYPNTKEDPLGEAICSNTWGCKMPDDGVDAPDGMIGISQDDGPLEYGKRLYDFFDQENINATHFYIGGNVLDNPDVFLQAKALPGQHFAVHTYTHPYMTGLSNEDVVAELGWTMQILTDSLDGRIPSFWRPPYGDVDNRVRAIATHVFGLKTILWNQDSDDWKIGAGKTEDQVKSDLTGWLNNGNQSPGLIILQHELNAGAVDAFISLWPLYQKWQTVNIPQLWDHAWYKNAQDDISRIVDGVDLVSPYTNGTLPSSNSSSSTTPSTSASSSSSPSPTSSAVSSAVASSSSAASNSAVPPAASSPASTASHSAVKAASSPSSSPNTSGAELTRSRSSLSALVGSLGLLASLL